jgi:hypothetical protein
MDRDGTWSIGTIHWKHSNLRRMHYWVSEYESRCGSYRRSLEPSPAPSLITTPEQAYEWAILKGESEEQACFHMQYARTQLARMLARWQEREQKKRDHICIEQMRVREEHNLELLAKLRRKIAKEETSPDWRYRALARMSELATQPLLAFAGDPEIERAHGSQVTGACCICGKTLTDATSLERGIGPECIRHLRTFDLADLVRLKQEMVAAHPDKGGCHEAFLAAYARYDAAKTAAERALPY